jgi:hypothetical protein
LSPFERARARGAGVCAGADLEFRDFDATIGFFDKKWSEK